MGRLEGKVAIVTGGAKGMGESHVREMVKEGAKIVIADLDDSNGEKLADEIGEDVIFAKLDVADNNSWEKIISKTLESFGSLDVLVNNAGVTGPAKHIDELEIEEYMTTVNVDLNGVFLGMKAAIAHMLEADGGSIVNIASTAGFRHVEGTPNAAYTAAKHGVIGLTKAGAVEYADNNIRINAVNPGGVLTPLMKESFTPEQIEVQGKASPAGRFGDPEEISQAVIFLASDDSTYINGESISVDGALSAN